jgi:hypothetical protein
VPESSPRRVAVPMTRKGRRRLDSSEIWRSTCFIDIIVSYLPSWRLVLSDITLEWRRDIRVDGFPGYGVD